MVFAIALSGLLPPHAEASTHEKCGDNRLSQKTAARYLNVKATLPGFQRVNPSELGIPALAVKRLHGQPVIFRSDEPFQVLFQVLSIVRGEKRKAKYRAEYADEAKGRTVALQQLREQAAQFGMSPDEIEAGFQFGGVSVGDHGWLSRVPVNSPDGPRVLEFLVFFQEKGCDAAVALVTSVSAPDAAGVVPLVLVGQEISRRIASR